MADDNGVMSRLREMHPPTQSTKTERLSNVIPLTDAFATEGIQQEIDVRFGYRIGRFGFVLEKSETTEILIDPTIYTIPNSPSWLFGMLNLRSNILPVTDISRFIGAALTSKKGSYVLSIGKAGDAMALLVDELPRALSRPRDMMELDVSNKQLKDFMRPGVQVGTTSWPLLDIKAVVRYLKQHENHRDANPEKITKGG